jgi:hypothetical protein
VIEFVAIPEVTHHDIAMEMAEVQFICQEYVTEKQLPCSVITIEDEVCYAYMNMKGETLGKVQCFIRRET